MGRVRTYDKDKHMYKYVARKKIKQRLTVATSVIFPITLVPTEIVKMEVYFAKLCTCFGRKITGSMH